MKQNTCHALLLFIAPMPECVLVLVTIAEVAITVDVDKVGSRRRITTIASSTRPDIKGKNK